MINFYYKFYFTIVPSYLGSILKVCRSVYEYMHHVSRSRSTWTWRNRTSFFIPKLVVFLLDFGGCREDVLHERVVLFSNFLSVDTKQNKNMIYRSQTATILLLVAHFWPNVALLRQTLLAHFSNLRSQRLTLVRQAVLHLRTDVRMCGEHEWCGATCNSVE